MSLEIPYSEKARSFRRNIIEPYIQKNVKHPGVHFSFSLDGLSANVKIHSRIPLLNMKLLFNHEGDLVGLGSKVEMNKSLGQSRLTQKKELILRAKFSPDKETPHMVELRDIVGFHLHKKKISEVRVLPNTVVTPYFAQRMAERGTPTRFNWVELAADIFMHQNIRDQRIFAHLTTSNSIH